MAGLTARPASSRVIDMPAPALSKIEEFEPALLLLDLRMPGKDGFAVLEELAQRPQRPTTIVITAHGSIEAAVKAVRMGAADFISKPFDTSHLEHVVAKTLETVHLRQRLLELESEVSTRHTLVAAPDSPMREVAETARRAASAQAPVLLLGESGVGKEVVARYIRSQPPSFGSVRGAELRQPEQRTARERGVWP